MRKILSLLFLCVIYFSCIDRKVEKFSINGSIKGLKDSTEISLSYLSYQNNKWTEISETVYLMKGYFSFSGSVDELTAAYLYFNNTEILFFIEPAEIKISIDMDHPQDLKISGISVDKEYMKLQSMLLENLMIRDNNIKNIQEVFYKMDSLNLKNNTDSINILMKHAKYLKSVHLQNESILDSLRLDFISKNNSSPFSPYLIYVLAKNNGINTQVLQEKYNQLPRRSIASLLGKQAHVQLKENYLIMNEGIISEGDVAPDFVSTDRKGETIKLSDFKNKNYILIDFWASWCAPCIKSIPDIKSIYNKFKDDGLVVIAISLDSETEEWDDAIKENGLESFIQIMGRKDKDNAFLTSAHDIDYIYGVKTIPQYYLINMEGTVIGKWNKIDDKVVDFICIQIQNDVCK